MKGRLKKFYIEGGPVEVVWVKRIGAYGDGHLKLGTQDAGKIRIALGQIEDDIRRTLLHEIMHECSQRGEGQSYYTQAAEERVFTVIEPWLYVTLRDNPELLAFLFPDAVREAARLL